MSARHFRRRGILTLAACAALVAAAHLEAQRRGFTNAGFATADDFDGAFQFCRAAFSGGGGFGSSWSVDYPRADINLSVRLSELTKTRISRDAASDPKHILVRLSDPEMFKCPFIMMTEIGSAYISPDEAQRLRDYLQKGGFLWADDFWGTNAWLWWEEQLRQVLPADEYPIVDLQPTHSLFRAQYVVEQTPQIASINFWYGSGGGTSERGADSEEVHTRAILDGHGHVMVLMTHNTDIGDSFEREADDPTYFLNFSVPGYAFGINALLYAMTH